MIILSQKSKITFCLISLLYIVLNILTFDHKLPWNDEVELTDTVANYVVFGQWISRAFADYGNQSPFSIYVPLHQMLLAVWMKIFGFSMASARTFNLFLTFLAGISLLGFAKKINKKDISVSAVLVFSVLLWGCAEVANIYRNGRGDMLGVLICCILCNVVYDYIKTPEKKYGYIICLLSILLVWSALQSCVYAVAAIVFVYCIFKDYRRPIFKVACLMALGFLIGFLLLCLYFWYNEHLFAFLVSIASLSGSLKSAAALSLPYIGPALGLNPEEWMAKLADDEVGPSLIEKMLSIFKFISFDILFVFTLLLFFINRKRVPKPFFSNSMVVIFLFVILVPVFMNLAGRYVEYYRWMSYIPLIIVVVLMWDYYDDKVTYSIISLGICCICIMGVASLFDKKQKAQNDEIKELCLRLPIQKKDVVSAPDMFFYEIRKKSDYCYFTKHYPVKYLDVSDLDYYIKNLDDFETTHNTKFSRQLQKVLDDDLSINLTPIDSSKVLNMIVYKVEHR